MTWIGGPFLDCPFLPCLPPKANRPSPATLRRRPDYWYVLQAGDPRDIAMARQSFPTPAPRDRRRVDLRQS